MLLWLWYRLAATTAIPPLAWEFPYAESAAVKSSKKKQTNKKNKKKQNKKTGLKFAEIPRAK